jgi:DNA polymerase-3 subunit delta
MDKPTLYILHGDDPFAIKRFIESMLARMGDPGMAELNTSRMDGRETSEEELRSACGALPFLSDRRLILLTHPFARLSVEPARARFRAMLEGLPDTTALVLVVDDSFERGDWRTLGGKHWLRRWMAERGEGRVFYHLCQLPPLNRMAEWIRQEAKNQGGRFSFEAAAALVAHVDNDTQLASLEITKLLTYVDGQREVELSDVEELTARGGQANVFEMVDALAEGNASLAQKLLHRLLEEEDELNLFGMVVRQFRLLLQAREILDEGKGVAEINQEVAHRDFLARKLADQARRFDMPGLEAIYRRLLEIDEAVKTGQSSMDVALNVLVAEMAR